MPRTSCEYLKFTLLLFCSFLLICSGRRSAFAAEKARFYDWQVDASAAGKAMKRCHLHFTGVSKKRIKITMRLSLVEERLASSKERGLTMLKISAGRINPLDRSKVRPIPLKSAWVATPSGTTLGRIHQIDLDADPHFLAGVEGFGLFFELLERIGASGLLLGYRTESDSEAHLLEAPPPPPQVLNQLQACLIDRKRVKAHPI